MRVGFYTLHHMTIIYWKTKDRYLKLRIKQRLGIPLFASENVNGESVIPEVTPHIQPWLDKAVKLGYVQIRHK